MDDELLKFLAEQLGLAIDVIQQNAGEVIAQYSQMKAMANWIGFGIGCILLLLGIMLIIRSFTDACFDEDACLIFGILVVLIGLTTCGFTLYYALTWTYTPIARLIDLLLKK